MAPGSHPQELLGLLRSPVEDVWGVHWLNLNGNFLGQHLVEPLPVSVQKVWVPLKKEQTRAVSWLGAEGGAPLQVSQEPLPTGPRQPGKCPGMELQPQHHWEGLEENGDGEGLAP